MCAKSTVFLVWGTLRKRPHVYMCTDGALRGKHSFLGGGHLRKRLMSTDDTALGFLDDEGNPVLFSGFVSHKVRPQYDCQEWLVEYDAQYELPSAVILKAAVLASTSRLRTSFLYSAVIVASLVLVASLLLSVMQVQQSSSQPHAYLLFHFPRRPRTNTPSTH